MGRIDPGALRAARLAGAALFAVGGADVVLRGNNLSRDERGAILLAAASVMRAFAPANRAFARRSRSPSAAAGSASHSRSAGAGAATLWAPRPADGGGPAALPPASAA
jgi:hypothetical protein